MLFSALSAICCLTSFNTMIDLNQVLAEKLSLLDRQLAEAKFTRDHATLPTE